jgi:hypothetical protein
MKDSPVITCSCGESMSKLIRACNFSIGGGLAKERVLDQMKKEGDIRADLKVHHGIENFTPLGGNTIEDVYRDVKGNGSMVKDQFAEEKYRNEKKKNEKVKDWKQKAQKRASKRREEMRVRKESEAAQKRAISL